MGIDVYWKDEGGIALGAVEDPDILSELSDLLYRQSSSACLRFVDPAGDACFNQLQLPILLSELRQLEASVVDSKAKEHVQRIVHLVEGATRRTPMCGSSVTSRAPKISFKPKPLRGSA